MGIVNIFFLLGTGGVIIRGCGLEAIIDAEKFEAESCCEEEVILQCETSGMFYLSTVCLYYSEDVTTI